MEVKVNGNLKEFSTYKDCTYCTKATTNMMLYPTVKCKTNNDVGLGYYCDQFEILEAYKDKLK